MNSHKLFFIGYLPSRIADESFFSLSHLWLIQLQIMYRYQD